MENRQQLFFMSCVALTVTAMTFAIRAGILGQLGVDFNLTDNQLGWINGMAFLGFPVAMVIGGMLYNSIGAKKMIITAFICHLLGLTLTVLATGFWGLLISTFFIGFANGAVEAGCNPLVSGIYKECKTTMLNKFHVWFPGGIVIGALISKVMTDASMGWQAQILIMLIPTFIYGYLIFKLVVPMSTPAKGTTRGNVKALFSPLFIFMALCMTLTTTAELGTQQWIERILGASGASPMLIMALITGLMAVGRYFAGPVIKKFDTVGVLLCSAIVSTIGIYSMSLASGPMVYFSAILFAIGVTYFWPTMVGFVAESIPQTGALGMSMIGGVGMFALSIWNPIIGQWIDDARNGALAASQNAEQAQVIAGQQVLQNLSLFPLVLIGAFLGLFLFLRRQKSAAAHHNENILSGS